MSKERDVVQTINAYLGKQAVDKSIMPLPKDHPLSPDKRSGLKGPDLMDTLRQAGEAIGVLKRKVPKESNRIDKARRPRNPIVTIKPGDPGYDEKLEEAQEAAQRNPQRERGLGSNRPMVEALDKSEKGFTANPYGPAPTGLKRLQQQPKAQKDQYPVAQQGGKLRGASVPDSAKARIIEEGWGAKAAAPKAANTKPKGQPFYYSDDIQKSMDLEEPSRSWSYQG